MGLLINHSLHYEKMPDGTVKCIEDEIPFELPEGWEWTRLESVFKLSSGKAIKVRQLEDDGEYPVYGGNGVNGLYSMYNVESETIIIGRVGFYCGSVYKTTSKAWVTDNALIASITEPSFYQIDFLCNLLKYLDLGQTSVSTAQPVVSGKGIYPLLVPIPPLDEQKRIVTKLNDCVSIVDVLESDKSDLQTIIQLTKSKILDLAIRGKLVPQNPDDDPASVLLERIKAEKEELIKQGKIKRDKKESVIYKGDDNSYYEKIGDTVTCIDEELPFELPDGWVWCCLSMIGQTNIGLTYSPADITPNGTMVLRSSNIVNNKLDFSDLVRVNTDIRDNQYVENNDILICARNGSKALVGKCALIQDMTEKASFGAFMAIYRTICFEYVFYYLQTFYFREIFYDSNSTAINQLTQSMIKNARIPLPPFDEQKRITEYLHNCFEIMDNIEKSLS